MGARSSKVDPYFRAEEVARRIDRAGHERNAHEIIKLTSSKLVINAKQINSVSANLSTIADRGVKKKTEYTQTVNVNSATLISKQRQINDLKRVIKVTVVCRAALVSLQTQLFDLVKACEEEYTELDRQFVVQHEQGGRKANSNSPTNFRIYKKTVQYSPQASFVENMARDDTSFVAAPEVDEDVYGVDASPSEVLTENQVKNASTATTKTAEKSSPMHSDRVDETNVGTIKIDQFVIQKSQILEEVTAAVTSSNNPEGDSDATSKKVLDEGTKNGSLAVSTVMDQSPKEKSPNDGKSNGITDLEEDSVSVEGNSLNKATTMVTSTNFTNKNGDNADADNDSGHLGFLTVSTVMDQSSKEESPNDGKSNGITDSKEDGVSVEGNSLNKATAMVTSTNFTNKNGDNDDVDNDSGHLGSLAVSTVMDQSSKEESPNDGKSNGITDLKEDDVSVEGNSLNKATAMVTSTNFTNKNGDNADADNDSGHLDPLFKQLLQLKDKNNSPAEAIAEELCSTKDHNKKSESSFEEIDYENLIKDEQQIDDYLNSSSTNMVVKLLPKIVRRSGDSDDAYKDTAKLNDGCDPLLVSSMTVELLPKSSIRKDCAGTIEVTEGVSSKELELNKNFLEVSLPSPRREANRDLVSFVGQEKKGHSVEENNIGDHQHQRGHLESSELPPSLKRKQRRINL